MAATRLRRTFQYPSESDDEDAVEEGMDAQDQEDLLTNLSSSDTSTTRTYTLILLTLPLFPTLLYIPRLFSTSTFLSSFAAVTSLLASAYALYFLPLPPVRVSVINASDIKANNNNNNKGKAAARDGQGRKSAEADDAVGNRPCVPYVSEEVANALAKYVVPANAALCAVLALQEWAQGSEWSEALAIGGGFVPGLVFVVVMVARRELRSVDLGELEKLRYRGKAS